MKECILFDYHMFKECEAITELTPGNFLIGQNVKGDTLYELHYCNSNYYEHALLIDDVWAAEITPIDYSAREKVVLYLLAENVINHDDFEIDKDFLYWTKFTAIYKKFRTITPEEFALYKLQRVNSSFIQSDTSCRISIITTVYNNAKMLEQTIQSVINQNCRNFEYIIKDACSTDDFDSVVKPYLKYGIKVYKQKDFGIYDGMHQAFLKAKGEYLQILNSDDIFHDKNVVATYMNEISQSHEDAYCSDILMHYPNKVIRRNADISKIKYRSCVNHTSLVLKRELYFSIGGFDLNLKIAADGELTIKLLKGGNVIKRIPFICVDFRATGVSNSRYSYEMLKENLICRMRYSKWNIGGYLYIIFQYVKLRLLRYVSSFDK